MKILLVRRLFLMVSALMLILVFGFIISRLFPGEKLLTTQLPSHGLQANVEMQKKMRERAFRVMGYDRPLFYISITSLAVPDSFTRMPDPVIRNTLTRLSYFSAQPGLSYELVHYVKKQYGEANPFQIANDKDDNIIKVRSDLLPLHSDKYILESLQKLNSPSLSIRMLKYLPCLSWTSDNQFHQWLFGSSSSYGSKGVLNGDFGKSVSTGMPVWVILKFSFSLSFLIAVFIILISVPVGILIGSFMAIKRRSKWVDVISATFLFIYNIPSFLFAISMVFLFANPAVLDVFPSSGPVLNTSEGFLKWLMSLAEQWKYMVLPVFVLSSSSIIFVSQLVFETLIGELEKPYALTLKAMGYSERYLLHHQLLKNTILPVLVTMAGLFPSLISGSMLIDYFFSLNGLGGVLMKACEQMDLAVMVGVFTAVGVVSVFTLYLTDIVIKTIDPRVNLKLKMEGDLQ